MQEQKSKQIHHALFSTTHSGRLNHDEKISLVESWASPLSLPSFSSTKQVHRQPGKEAYDRIINHINR
jgi:hypothetical protein